MSGEERTLGVATTHVTCNKFIGEADMTFALNGSTPIGQRADASQVAITDNTGGTVLNIFPATVGIFTIAIPITLSSLGNADVLTAYTPGFKFNILAADFIVGDPVTTAAKLATLNLEIGTTNVIGGTIALTSANCTPLGAVVAGAAISGANFGSSAATISVEGSSVTTFIEGNGYLMLKLQNLDTTDAIASLSDKWNELRTTLVNFGFITGAA